MKVTVDVPDGMPYQFVYRMTLATGGAGASGMALPEDFGFALLDSAWKGVRRLSALRGRFGLAGACRVIAKLATAGRSLYLVTRRGQVLSDGWCTVGRCNYYQVEPGAVVVGPIWTSPEVRGRGLASAALRAAIAEFAKRGYGPFYIDTSDSNVSAQRVFEKCGFGAPVALFLRTRDSL